MIGGVKVIYRNIVSSDIKPGSDRKDNIINLSLDRSIISDISQRSRNYILKDVIFHRSPNEDVMNKEEKPNLLN
jgi:hypothetical protein